MRGTLHRYVLRLYLQYFGAIYLVTVAVFLLADMSDRAKLFVDRSVRDVAWLYWNKLLVTAQLLGPAAMLLGAAATISTLRRRGELTAMQALAFSPRALYAPIASAALVIAVGLVAFDEYVATDAGARVDEITVTRFNTWGDWRFYYQPKQWFRKGDRVFYLRAGGIDGGFESVSIFMLTPEFRLASRLDARRMEHVDGNRWRLMGVNEREFLPRGGTRVSSHAEVERDLGVGKAAFGIRQGRPEQMKTQQLREQVRARRQVSLPVQRFALALHNRFAYPLTGCSAALLAVGLALRPNRKGHLTVALVEGLAIAVVLWGLMVVGKALVLGNRVPAGMAAWLPFMVLLGGALALGLRRRGMLAWLPL